MEYAVAEWRNKYRIASENPAKEDVVAALLERYSDSRVLIIGQYLQAAAAAAQALQHAAHHRPDAEQPSARTCTTSSARGEVRQLILSKVGNFALDLPDANVLIQVSGTFGSRQEEAQRLGRILRPKPGGEVAHFYTLVTRDTREQDFAHHRQLFLTEQGYSYQHRRRRRVDRADASGGMTLPASGGVYPRRWDLPAGINPAARSVSVCKRLEGASC